METELSAWRRKTETKLPPKGNPQTRSLARDLRADSASDAELVDRVLNKFNSDPYVYTLQPGTLPRVDAMDAFMFQTRRGFCEHYAAAFVIMMRAAGVPARVVAGYLGGEINPVNKTVIVHQFDAHAWAEVWLEGRGWVRVDPTASVSPDRIEWGLEEAMQEEGSFLSGAPLSPLKYRNIPLLNQLRLRYDALTYRWQSWVVGFNSEQQFDLLHGLLGELTARKFAAVLLGSWALVLIPVAISLLRRRNTHQVTLLDKYYLKFCKRLDQQGLSREAGETPTQFASRAALELPAAAEQLGHIANLYNELAYAANKPAMELTRKQLQEFIGAVNSFRPSKRTRQRMPA